MAVNHPQVPTYKIVLLGEVDAGKTTLFYHVKEGRYVSSERYGPGHDYCTKEYEIDKETVKIVLWDTAGVERFRTLTRNYFRGACAVIFTYNTQTKDSLLNLVQFVEDAQESVPKALRYLIGCKCDLPSDKSLNLDAKRFAEAHGCEKLFLTSAYTGHGVEDAFKEIAKEVHTLHKRKLTSDTKRSSTVNLGFNSSSAMEAKSDDACSC